LKLLSRRWNARQWLWLCVLGVVVLFTFVMSSLVHRMTDYCYWYEDPADIPPGKYIAYVVPTDEYVEQYDRVGGYAVETISDPANPWWVRFYHESDLFAWGGIVGLAYCLYRFDKAGEKPKPEDKPAGLYSR